VLTGASFQPDSPTAVITLKDGSRRPPRPPKIWQLFGVSRV